jgi:peptidoglycan lytic transglycosylase
MNAQNNTGGAMRIQLAMPMLLGFCTLALIATFPRSSPAQQKAAKEVHASTVAVKEETGTAVFYSDKLVGRPLTSGEKYDKNALTAAHRTLLLGTMVKVTNLKNNKSVVVRINDRGPHGPKTEIIDVSGRAAQELDMIKDGRAKVKLEVVEVAKK